jgi:2-oxoisovalerate dehydrogenase E1 component
MTDRIPLFRNGAPSAGDFPNIIRVGADAGDWSTEDRRVLGFMLLQLETIRLFERWLLDHEDIVHGPIHSSIGQEAVAVGACAALRPGDTITSTHRAHHHVLAKAMSHYVPADFDPFAPGPLPDPLLGCVHRTMAEIMGLASGWQGGRGGSMHLYDGESGVIGTSAIVGGGIPIASGAALVERIRATGNISLAFFGDGASSIGAFHEGISMARVWNLPAIFVVENNLYSVATTVRETVGFEDIAIRAAGQAIPGLIVDGMDVLAMKRAVDIARANAAAGAGPSLIEAKTYRYLHQNGNLPGSAFLYRTQEEEAAWAKRDPLLIGEQALLAAGVCTKNEIESIREQARLLVAHASKNCMTEEDGQAVIPTQHWPEPTDALRGVVSGGREFDGIEFHEPSEFADTEEMTLVTAISKVLHRAMERDPDVFVLGEEVSHFRGGVYGATTNALEAFPDRVMSTPICELGFSGVALGAALRGMKPIIEIMFPDFTLVAADQLFNHIAKARYMYGGDIALPIVLRTRTAQGRGYGPQHSSDPAALFALFPGWRIMAPSTPADYIGLFNAAITSEDPVLIIEHHRLWQVVGPVPRDNLDYVIPFSTAALRREGSDVTVLTWSEPTHRVLQIADELAPDGLSVEVIDLRMLDRNSLDMSAVETSARKTQCVVIVEDAMRSHSIGVHIADVIHAAFADLLAQPVIRVTGKDVPSPVSKALEDHVLLADADIRSAIRGAADGTVW